MLPGTGSAKLNRYYFNQQTRQCLQFTYTGRGGNQNSFLSEADCAARCPGKLDLCIFNTHSKHNCSIPHSMCLIHVTITDTILFCTDRRQRMSSRLLVSRRCNNRVISLLSWWFVCFFYTSVVVVVLLCVV